MRDRATTAPTRLGDRAGARARGCRISRNQAPPAGFGHRARARPVHLASIDLENRNLELIGDLAGALPLLRRVRRTSTDDSEKAFRTENLAGDQREIRRIDATTEAEQGRSRLTKPVPQRGFASEQSFGVVGNHAGSRRRRACHGAGHRHRRRHRMASGDHRGERLMSRKLASSSTPRQFSGQRGGTTSCTTVK